MQKALIGDREDHCWLTPSFSKFKQLDWAESMLQTTRKIELMPAGLCYAGVVDRRSGTSLSIDTNLVQV